MKKLLKQLFVHYLRFLAQRKLKRSGAKIIAITGSVGKTTTKDMIAEILSSTYRIAKTEGNYNSEIGLPLSILHQKTGKSPVGWLFVIGRCFWNSFKKEPYDFFIAEMGADKPGDIQELCHIIKPHISVVTTVAKMHLEEGQFENEQDIQKEKSEIVRCLGPENIAILNEDNTFVREMRQWTKASVISYGKDPASTVQIQSIQTTEQGFQVTICYQKQLYSFRVPLIGSFLIYALLPALAIALLQKIPTEKIQLSLEKMKLPNGRFNLIEGIQNSHIIDSTYNASPYAVIQSLESIKEMHANRRIAVLGNMNELGKYSESEHRRVGTTAATCCNIIFTLGKDAIYIGEEALKHNPSIHIQHFQKRTELINVLQQEIQENDIILLKGSQNGVFLEEVVKAIMKYPEQADDLLVRQGKEWVSKKRE